MAEKTKAQKMLEVIDGHGTTYVEGLITDHELCLMILNVVTEYLYNSMKMGKIS
uniref:Uncharacterized protein n=1 Tax=viral metagenome TaxID=1070528 RepID=A0A6M3IJG9_9ZZZZ